MARGEKARLATESRFLRTRQRGISVLVEFARDEFSFVWLAPLAFIGLVQPWIWQGGFSVFGHAEETSVDFIGILWQVQGAALGLSLAVVLFVFQSVYGNRLGGSLRDFAEETWLFPIFYAGLIGLVLDGAVLLHVGQGAPGRWAASWAVIWAFGTAIALGFLFVSTIHAIDPGSIHELRLRRTRRAVEAAIEDVIFRRVATVLLGQFCEAHAIEYSPWFGRSVRGATIVKARRAGEVRDIRLRALRRVAEKSHHRGLPQPLLRAELGRAVRAGSDLVSVDSALARATGRLRRSFRLRRMEKDKFRTLIKDLHDEAVIAIRTPSPATYSAIKNLYEDVLLVLPETWARYGQLYSSDIEGGASPFELSPQDYLDRQLYEEMTAAAKSGSRDIAHDALDLPIIVAQRALEVRALALTRRMISLWVAARRAMFRDADQDDVRSLLEWSWLRMSEYSYRPQALVTEDTSDDEARQLGKDALLQVWDGYANLCKGILDSRPRDTELLGQINEVWDEPLQHWNPEHSDPDDWQLRVAIERGEPEDEVERIRGELAANQRWVDVKQELLDWRALHRFGLLFWILRNVRDRGDVESWRPAWTTFAGYFGNVPRLAQILDKGIEADWEDRGRWSNWVMESLSRRQVHGLAVDLEFIQTFVVLALNLIPPDGPAPQIDPMKHGTGRLENPRETVEGIVAIENLQPLLPPDRLDDRTQLLVAALEQMRALEEEQKEQAIIDAPIEDELVNEFVEKLRGKWRTSRGVREIFNAIGVVERGPTAVPALGGSQNKRWMLKAMFIREPRVYGLEMTAEEWGRGLARWEWNKLVDCATESPEVVVADGMSAGERLRAALDELRAAGYQPSLVIAGGGRWRLYQALDLRLAPNFGGDAAVPDWLQDAEGRESFLGTVDDIPVFEYFEFRDGVSNDDARVFDLGRFAIFKESDNPDPPGPVTVEITAHTEDEVRDLVRQDRVNFDESLDEDARVRRLLQHVVVDAVYPFDIEVVDAHAARHVNVADAIPENGPDGATTAP
ncbi:MAG TPA: hypothetical protein VHC67_14800 [Gaiellaceae bacterium]|nr:hypothetical protein [Gaiellaceae bacterium]